jgi:glycerate 2-kinase
VSRRALLEIYQAGIESVDGRHRTAAALREESLTGPVRLIAIGKAAPAMALGAIDVLGPRIADGLVVTRRGLRRPELDGRDAWLQLEAGHPVPDESSLAAGEALLARLAGASPDALWLFLISGGSSSLVEVLPPGLDLARLRRANEWLIGSGLPIGAVNAVRRRLSVLKGGRLAGRLDGRRCLALYISDVPGDAVSDIGSGLLAPAPGSSPTPTLPDWLRAVPEPGRPPAPPIPIRHRVIASLAVALIACETEARRHFDFVRRFDRRLDLDVEAAAKLVVDRLVAGPPGAYLWGGETTVRLPPDPGRGGRNQHLALACAMRLAGRSDAAVLCGATDGNDGPGEDAGGLVDGGSVRRGEAAGLGAADCFARADAGSFLAAAGDLVSTGPTSTNVNDLVIGVRSPAG